MAGPHAIKLLYLLLRIMLGVVVFGFGQLLLFLFHLLSFYDVLLEFCHVFTFDLYVLKFTFLLHLLGYLNHFALEFVGHLVSQLGGPRHSLLISLKSVLNRFNLLHLVQLREVILCSPSR